MWDFVFQWMEWLLAHNTGRLSEIKVSVWQYWLLSQQLLFQHYDLVQMYRIRDDHWGCVWWRTPESASPSNCVHFVYSCTQKVQQEIDQSIVKKNNVQNTKCKWLLMRCQKLSIHFTGIVTAKFWFNCNACNSVAHGPRVRWKCNKTQAKSSVTQNVHKCLLGKSLGRWHSITSRRMLCQEAQMI